MHPMPDNPYATALQYIQCHGGIDALPEILTMQNAFTLCGCPRSWLLALFQHDALPGSCFGTTSTLWRCERHTFVNWLKEHADDYQPLMAQHQQHHPPHPISRGIPVGGRSR
jgi:hypothetical protein